MDYDGKAWRIKAANPIMRQVLADRLNISLITAQLLLNRGLVTGQEASDFFEGNINGLCRPELLPDIDIAVAVILQYIERNEKITVYGDYDVDGITGTVILMKMLQRLGADVNWYIPSRLQEGYGLNKAALDELQRAGTQLIVSVDCGVSNYAEVSYANSCGMQVIITDHHEAPDVLPQALAVIDPKRPDCEYPFRKLAGAGVGWKLGQALFREKFRQEGYINKKFDDLAAFAYLDLVALGTIADIVPLESENRLLVKYGLEQLNRTEHTGLRVFCQKVLTSGQVECEEDITFILAPRMNAAGRMGQTELAVNLLLTENEAEAEELTAALTRINGERQSVEMCICREALSMIAGYDLLNEDIIILDSDNWHSGVIGIVSAKLMERFKKPIILIAVENEIGKASCRSIPGINIYQALEHCRNFLLQFGGHSQAAGFSIAKDNIEAFRTEIGAYIRDNQLTAGLRTEKVLEAELPLVEINEQLVQEINALQPFGCGNPKPFFISQGRVVNSRLVGKNFNHLKLTLGSGNCLVDAIGFNLGEYEKIAETNNLVDFIFWPEENHYNGRTMIQLKLKDIKTEEDTVIYEQTECHWIIKELNKSLAWHKNGRALGWDGNGFADLLTCSELQTDVIFEPRNFHFKDQRNHSNVAEYIVGLGRQQGITMVLTADDNQTLELLAYLNKSGYAEEQLAVLLSVSRYPRLQELTEIMFKSVAAGKYTYLLTTPAAFFNYYKQVSASINVQQVVFCSRIIEKQKIKAILAAVDDGSQKNIHFLANDKELKKLNYLLQMIPDRSFLSKLYMFFKRCLQGNSSLNVQEFTANGAGMDKISSLLGEKITAAKFKMGARIFGELGLLQYLGDNIRLNSQAPPKTELVDSTTFCCLNRWAEQVTEFQNELDNLPRNGLQELFQAI